MFSVFIFQFQQNKFYPNKPLVPIWIWLPTSAFWSFFFFFFLFFLFLKSISCDYALFSRFRALCMRPTTSLTSKIFTGMCLSVGPVHCSWDPQTSFLAKFLLKMSLTILFTHLQIILLQYFQFSIISSIQMYP